MDPLTLNLGAKQKVIRVALVEFEQLFQDFEVLIFLERYQLVLLNLTTHYQFTEHSTSFVLRMNCFHSKTQQAFNLFVKLEHLMRKVLPFFSKPFT